MKNRERSVLEYLEHSANVHGEKIAFSDENCTITYSQLQSVVASIGTKLGRRLGNKKSPIAVMIDRNIQSICCFLGVVASGNFYIPIDGSLPIERIDTIISQMQPHCIISIGGNAPQGIGKVEVFEYEELVATIPDPDLLTSIRRASLDTDPLYAICTSGSTGVPKGVLISHRSVLDFIHVFAETFSFDESECFGNQAPFDFDVSVKDIYTTLYCGASMHVIPKVCFTMPKQLPTVLDKHRITTIIWAVSALCIVAGFNAFKYCVPSNLKKVLFSGEAMPVKQLNVWKRYFPDAMFVNLYGPTEITCNCMYYIVDREFNDNERLPLGAAFSNEEILVLGADNKPIAEGETGEVCVIGTCLALGYYLNPNKTAESFVQNPLNDRYPELMYRTGDLVRLENGEYYFAGRSDFQIKHMGHRIELEEIELYLNALEGIDRACCLFDEGKNKIIACYAGNADRADIVKGLGRKLPKYMIPNIYFHIEQMPLTKNGKIDRKRLAEECSIC